MEAVEDVVSGHVGSRVLVETPGLGVAVPIVLEVTQSFKSLLVQGCGFVPSEEVCIKHAPGLLSSLGLLVFLHMLPRRGGDEELVQHLVHFLRVCQEGACERAILFKFFVGFAISGAP